MQQNSVHLWPASLANRQDEICHLCSTDSYIYPGVFTENTISCASLPKGRGTVDFFKFFDTIKNRNVDQRKIATCGPLIRPVAHASFLTERWWKMSYFWLEALRDGSVMVLAGIIVYLIQKKIDTFWKNHKH